MSEETEFRLPPELSADIEASHRHALTIYTSLVEQILCEKSRDVRHIEETLDGLLDFCGNDALLLLYRQLCRHYFDIDPAATADYINMYRELYDSDDEAEKP